MKITTISQLKSASKTFDKLIAEMGEDAAKQAQAKSLAEAIQTYEKEHISFPTPILKPKY